MRLAAPIPRISACVRIEFSQKSLKRSRREDGDDERADPIARSAICFEVRGSRGPPEQALRAERENERHQHEGEDDRVLRAALVPSSAGRRPRTRRRARTGSEPTAAPASEPMPPMITTTRGEQEPLAVLPLRDRRLRPADGGSERRERGADEEGDRERRLDVDADAEVIWRSSTPARMTMPVFVLCSQSQRTSPTPIPSASMTRRASE